MEAWGRKVNEKTLRQIQFYAGRSDIRAFPQTLFCYFFGRLFREKIGVEKLWKSCFRNYINPMSLCFIHTTDTLFCCFVAKAMPHHQVLSRVRARRAVRALAYGCVVDPELIDTDVAEALLASCYVNQSYRVSMAKSRDTVRLESLQDYEARFMSCEAAFRFTSAEILALCESLEIHRNFFVVIIDSRLGHARQAQRRSHETNPAKSP
jgi:hypothetical protein